MGCSLGLRQQGSQLEGCHNLRQGLFALLSAGQAPLRMDAMAGTGDKAPGKACHVSSSHMCWVFR